MRIEIDTSSRLDQSGDTVFGFSDHIQKAIILKQTIRNEYMERLAGGRFNRELRIFAACIYLLIEEYLDELKEVNIDQEYPGHEGDIKRHLANIIQTHHPYTQFRAGYIRSMSIGKKSQAHEVLFVRKETLIRLSAPEMFFLYC